MIEWLFGLLLENLISVYVLILIVLYLQRLSRMETNVWPGGKFDQHFGIRESMMNDLNDCCSTALAAKDHTATCIEINLSEDSHEDRTLSADVTTKDTVDTVTLDEGTANSDEEAPPLDEGTVNLDGDTVSVEDTVIFDEAAPTLNEHTVISERDSPTSGRDTALSGEDTARSDKNSAALDEDTVNSDEDVVALDNDTGDLNKKTAYLSTATLKDLDGNQNGTSILAAELARDLKRLPELMLIADMSKVYYEVNGVPFLDNGVMGSHQNETIVPYELYKVAKDDEIESEDEDLTTELEVTIQNFPQGFVINSNVFLTDAQWHTMSLVDGLFRCAVCQMYCERVNCVDHIEMASHLHNLDQYRPLKKFDLSIVRKINENFHCGVCNEIFDIIDYTTHEDGKTHEENLLTAINKVSDLTYDSNIHGNFFTDRKFHYTDRIISNADRNIQGPVRNVHIADRTNRSPDRNIRTPDRQFRNNNELHFDAYAFNQNPVNIYEEYSDDGEETEEYTYDGEEYTTPFEGISYAKMASKPRIELPKFLKIDLGTKEVRVKFEYWHMIVKTEANKFYCMVCNEHDLIRFKSKHCISCGHLEKLAQCNVVGAFEDYLIRKVNDRLYHCGHCNNLQYQNQMNDHIQFVHPKKNSNFIDNTKNIKRNKNDARKSVDLKTSDIQRDSVGTNKLQSRIDSKVDIVFDVFDEVKISPFGCELRVPVLTFNFIMTSDGDYYCAICDKECPDVQGHLEESEHVELMTMSPFIRPFKNHLTRAVRGTLHCSLCNKLLPVGEIYNHNVDESHINSLAIAMGMKKAQKQPTNNQKNFINTDMNKASGDQNSATVDLKTATVDLKTSGDLKMARGDLKTPTVDLKTSGDLKMARDDLKTPTVDLKTSGDLKMARGDLKTVSGDLNKANADLKAHEIPEPIAVNIPNVCPVDKNSQLFKNNAQSNVSKISDSKIPTIASPSPKIEKTDAQIGVANQNIHEMGQNGSNFFRPPLDFNFRPPVPISPQYGQPGQYYPNIGQNAAFPGQNYQGLTFNPASMGQNYQNPAQNFQYPIHNAGLPGQNFRYPVQTAAQNHHSQNSFPRPNIQHGPNQYPAKNQNLPPPMYNQFFPELPPVNAQSLTAQFVGAPLNYNFNGTRPSMAYQPTQYTNQSKNSTVEQQKTVKNQANKANVKSDIKSGTDIIKTSTDIKKPGTDINKTGRDINKIGTDIVKSNNDTIESVDISIDSTQTEEEECKEFDEEELVFLKMKTAYFKITNLSYNTLVYLDINTRHCFVCSNTIRVPFLHKHVESRLHAENIAKNKFLDKYGVQLFRQMYLMYHCAICNVLMTRKEIKLHLDWPMHIENYNIAHRILNKKNRKELKSGIKEYPVETQKESIFNNVNEPKFTIIAAYQIVPSMEVDKAALETKPAKGSNSTAVKKNKMVILNNVVMKVSFDHWHGITSSKNVTKCIICQVELGQNEVFDHVVTEYHEVALGKLFEKPYYPALIRIINDNSINCMMCNLELPNNEYMVYEHINGRKHNKNQEAIVNEGSNSDSYADCYEDYLNL